MTQPTQLTGSCPECETPLSTPPMIQGETMSCPECLLTLRVDDVSGGALVLEMVETQLRDWGQ